MSINKKIIQYLDYKGVSQREFTRRADLSEGILRRGRNLGSKYMKRVKTICTDLNFNWLLFDEGNMILDDFNMANEPSSNYGKECEKELSLLQKDHIEIQKELLKSKDIIVSLTKSNKLLKKKLK